VGGLILVILYVLLGGNPQALLQSGGPGARGPVQSGPASAPPANDAEASLVSRVLGDTEDVWSDIFAKGGQRYEAPKLRLFRDATDTACGAADSAVGPFYCPGDNKVYIDLSFFNELSTRFHAPGDFAQAYVIAHEVGHHIQFLRGVSQKVSRMRGRVSEPEYNDLSVRLELQADYYAGVWAHHAQKARHILEAGDLEEGLAAAAAVGDDRLQKQARGYVVPDSFTHGTSEQRVRWFKKGFESGDPNGGDTFTVKKP
jgi:predicted metalloprotease